MKRYVLWVLALIVALESCENRKGGAQAESLYGAAQRDVETQSVSVEKAKAELTEDMKNIAKAMKLLQMDYLGGHGTRGSGRVSFEEIELQPFFCDDVMTNMLPELKKLFEDVESYELLPV